MDIWFELDDAVDFFNEIRDLSQEKRAGHVHGALTDVLLEDGYLELDVAARGLAATVLIAADIAPRYASALLADHPVRSAPLGESAAEMQRDIPRVLMRIATEPSELFEVYEEDGRYDEVLSAVSSISSAIDAA